MYAEMLFVTYLMAGLVVFLVDLILHVETWITERLSFILFMCVVFLFLWPLAVWDYAHFALRKWKGGIRG